MTQTQAIVKYLKTHKKASGLDFVKKLGVMCYTKVISEIRADFAQENEYVIHTELKTVNTRYGKTRVAFYSLVKVSSKPKKNHKKLREQK